ncbi:MAG: nucleoside deaminase [Proteobacteria bacterium]|nr:nucleoside deaminase [Pseudomonadota bacterium]MBU4471726.1 nucleoside deaminase [Pseudomonadota bacterium]MCG2750507.1 nucleoside deaminase [Desulfobacteraceae bacterium]
MNYPGISIQLPLWIQDLVDRSPGVFSSKEDRMRFVITLSRKNVEHQTGGPFGAAIFDDQGRLVAPGVNLVLSTNCSIFHAEITAIAMAQTLLGRYDLSDGGNLSYALYASTEPCAMCFGAIPWSGVSRLVCGARDEDARRIGFDEGPKMADWIDALETRKIKVVRDLLRAEAVSVLDDYAASGGVIYNSGKTLRGER